MNLGTTYWKSITMYSSVSHMMFTTNKQGSMLSIYKPIMTKHHIYDEHYLISLKISLESYDKLSVCLEIGRSFS